MELDKNGLIAGTRDKLHNASFFEIAHWQRQKSKHVPTLINKCKELLICSYVNQIKDPDYFWSNSGSQNEEENTFFNRPTFWIYKNILKPIERLTHLSLDMRKGSNPDQLLPASIYAQLRGDKELLAKIYLGVLFRLGFYPNGEHIFFKLHHLTPLFRHLGIKFAYTVFDFFFYIGVLLKMRKPLNNTSNKIKDFIYLLSAQETKTQSFFTEKALEKYYCYAIDHKANDINSLFKAVFSIYFGSDHEITKTFFEK